MGKLWRYQNIIRVRRKLNTLEAGSNIQNLRRIVEFDRFMIVDADELAQPARNGLPEGTVLAAIDKDPIGLPMKDRIELGSLHIVLMWIAILVFDRDVVGLAAREVDVMVPNGCVIQVERLALLDYFRVVFEGGCRDWDFGVSIFYHDGWVVDRVF